MNRAALVMLLQVLRDNGGLSELCPQSRSAKLTAQVLCRWEQGEIAEWSAISYPDQVLTYVQTEFQKIKTKQAQLLGIYQTGIRSKL